MTRGLVPGLLALAGLLASPGLLAPTGRGAPSGRALAAEEPRAYPGLAVSVVKVDRRCFTDRVQLTGTLVPKAEVQVRPEQEGLQVSQVLVEPGDMVVSGQILARLTSPPGAPAQTVAVKSPVAGMASAVGAVVGAYASAAADPLFRIVTDGEYQLQGEVQAASLPRLKPDQRATLHLLGIVGTLDGRVVSTGASIDAMSQLGSARISAGNDPRLRGGMYARAEVDTGQTCGFAVPLSAVLYGGDGAIVQVVHDDRIETRRVEIGLLDRDILEIRDGLVESDVVVDHAGAFLREGDRVRPVEVQPERKP